MAVIRARGPALAAAALFLASLALFWPGYAMYDSVAQYRQVLSGQYEDWHPPAMARLWSLMGAGAGPMLALQLAGYWLGFALIAIRLGTRAGAAVLAIGAMPLFLGWQAVVLKDAQMVAAMLAATGIVAWWRLAGRRLPTAAVGAVVALLTYAMLTRANAVFAAVPFAVLLSPLPRRPAPRALLAVAGMIGVLAVASPINHLLLGAAPTGVERTQAIYDLAGIAVNVGPGASAIGLTPDETRELVAKRCVRAYFWDPLGEPSRCDATVERLRHVAVPALYATLAGATVQHPLAYARHRIAHLNSTERWLVPWRWPGAAPPQHSEPNTLGLDSPGRFATGWQALAGWVAETPLGWPIAWLAIAIGALAVAIGRAASPPRDLALALLGSALCLEASFAVLSIASDLRYHLWPMIAIALGTALLLREGKPSRHVAIADAALLAIVVGAGLVARASLPLPPQSYVGMLG